MACPVMGRSADGPTWFSRFVRNAENVRTFAENTTDFRDFQAEYEGSIPFTRSIP
jgi:hypothetical protein